MWSSKCVDLNFLQENLEKRRPLGPMIIVAYPWKKMGELLWGKLEFICEENLSVEINISSFIASVSSST